MQVLIAGGAGFIGSTIASACVDAGISPVIVDNLGTGRREFTTGRAFYQGDIADGALIDRIFADHPGISAAIQCAALIVVPDSVADPVGYYRANVAKSLEFVAHLLRNGCERMIFSSSAAIYRPAADLTVDEDSPLDPQSPYARTKAVCEEMFADIAATQAIRVLSLRYFNPIGADPKLRTGLQLRRPTHALGKLIQAYEEGVPFQITGTDYPTRDGTGIRDYVHVWDLATAHLAALDRLPLSPNRAGRCSAGRRGQNSSKAGMDRHRRRFQRSPGRPRNVAQHGPDNGRGQSLIPAGPGKDGFQPVSRLALRPPRANVTISGETGGGTARAR